MITKQIHNTYLSCVLYILIVCLVFVKTGYAEPVDTSQISSGFWEIYTIIRNTSTFVGAVSVAFCGYHIIVGNSNDYEKYKRIAILCALAVGFIWALPAVINSAKSIGKAHAWNPSNPGF